MIQCLKILIFNAAILLCGPVLAEFADPELKFPAHERPGKDIHVNLDIVFKNDYITPRGLLVSDTGLTTQVFLGLEFDLLHKPTCFIDKISFVAGVWNDVWSNQHSRYVGSWNELDWFVGANFKIFKDWKLTVQYIEFLSPPSHFQPEDSMEFILSYDDSGWKLPIVFNPYVMFFWAIYGDSTVVVGKRGRTYYFELGASPSVDFSICKTPISISAPTWITIGPANFWNGGTFGLKRVKDNFGVFSTGLKAKMPMKFIPPRLGSWYFDAGVQYYYLINENLLQAQKFTLGIHSLKSARRNVVVPFAGIGCDF